MKLYLATYNEHVGYDQYSSFVIAAESEDLARQVIYKELEVDYEDDGEPYQYWMYDQVPEDFTITELVPDNREPGVVVSSFHAG